MTPDPGICPAKRIRISSRKYHRPCNGQKLYRPTAYASEQMFYAEDVPLAGVGDDMDDTFIGSILQLHFILTLILIDNVCNTEARKTRRNHDQTHVIYLCDDHDTRTQTAMGTRPSCITQSVSARLAPLQSISRRVCWIYYAYKRTAVIAQS